MSGNQSSTMFRAYEQLKLYVMRGHYGLSYTGEVNVKCREGEVEGQETYICNAKQGTART